MFREREFIEEARATQLRSNTASDVDSVESPSPVLIPVPVIIPPQAKNQLLNSDFSHSVRTWNSATPLSDDMNKECAFWFSNDAPVLGQVLSTENLYLNPATPNETLKSSAHGSYDPDYADWDSVAGTARIGTDKTLDALQAGREILPSRPYYISFICARKNIYTVFPSTAYIYAGFWKNDGASSYWITGTNPFQVTGTVVGSPATTTEQRYRIYARTDRARTFLSDELVIANAPDDAAFALGATVDLSWTRLQDFGILSYDVYRYTPALLEYLLLEQVESGVTVYTDNNRREDVTVSAYPTATDDRSIALTTTRILGNDASALNSMAVDGVSPAWLSLPIPIRVPADFDTSASAEQWLRIGIGGLPNGTTDLSIPAVVITGAVNVFWDGGVFTSDLVGLDVIVSDGVVRYDTTVASFTDAENITLSVGIPAIPDGTYSLYIEGGGDKHAILIDCVHQSYNDGATYSRHGEDSTPPRPQYPVASPNGSNQGGTGTGGIGTDGGGFCPEVSQPIVVLYGNQTVQKRIGDITVGEVVESEGLKPNIVTNVEKVECSDLWILETKNGCSIIASASHPIICSRLDTWGTPMDAITKGQKVRTYKKGAFVQSVVSRIESLGKAGVVVKLSCTPTPYFVAGSAGQDVGGLLSHNNKPINQE